MIVFLQRRYIYIADEFIRIALCYVALSATRVGRERTSFRLTSRFRLILVAISLRDTATQRTRIDSYARHEYQCEYYLKITPFVHKCTSGFS